MMTLAHGIMDHAKPLLDGPVKSGILYPPFRRPSIEPEIDDVIGCHGIAV